MFSSLGRPIFRQQHPQLEAIFSLYLIALFAAMIAGVCVHFALISVRAFQEGIREGKRRQESRAGQPNVLQMPDTARSNEG